MPINLKDVKSFRESEAAPATESPAVASAMPAPVEATPPGALQGRVTYTPQVNANIDRYMSELASPNPLLNFVRAGGLGFEAIPEAATNLVAGGIQHMANVPEAQRMTAGDLMRMVTPNYASPSEITNSPQYQQFQQQAPAGPIASGLGNFVGSMAFPMGAITKPLGMVPGVAPALAKGRLAASALGKSVPASNVAGEMANRLGATWQGTVAKSALAHAGTGAGYGAAFGAGEHFGQTGQMPSPPQLAGMAAGGAAIGGTLGTGIGALQAFINRNVLAKIAASRFAQSPEQVAASEQQAQQNALRGFIDQAGAARDMAPEEAMYRYQQAMNQIESTALPPAVKQKYITNAVRQFNKNYGGDEYSRARSSVANEGMRISKNRDKKADQKETHKQKTETAQRAKAENDARKNQTVGAQTGKSGNRFRELTDKIQEASKGELEDLRRAIYDPGSGAQGKRLLDTKQQQQLEKTLRARARQLRERTDPGKAKVGTQEQPQESRPTTKEEATAAPEKAEVPPAEKETAPVQETKATEPPKPAEVTDEVAEKVQRLMGVARKNLANKLPHERFKSSETVDEFLKSKDIPKDDHEFVRAQIKDLAEAATDSQVKNMRIQQLAEWALKHGDKLEGEATLSRKEGSPSALLKQAELGGIRLKATVENLLAAEGEEALALYKSKLIDEGVKRGDIKSLEERITDIIESGGNGRGGHVETLLNGKATKWEVKDGKLEADIKSRDSALPEFVPPKTTDELYDRLAKLINQRAEAEEFRKEVAAEIGPTGRTLSQIMGDALHEQIAKGELPPMTVNHVDKFGYVTTVTYKQQSFRVGFNKETKDLESRFKAMRDQMLAQYKKGERTTFDAAHVANKMLSVGGGEIVGLYMASLIFSRGVNKALRYLSKSTPLKGIATVGTIVDNFKATPELDGHKLAQRLSDMQGEIFHAFASDAANVLYHFKGAEDLARLQNEFKGVKHSQRAFIKHALTQLKAGFGQAEADVAIARARTAFLIRDKYRELAKHLQNTYLKPMDAIKADMDKLDPSRAKLYPSEMVINGKLRFDAFNHGFYDSVKALHDGLLFKPGKESIGALFSGVASRQARSFFANSFKTGFANIFDAGHLAHVYYDRNWWRGAFKLMGDKNARALVDRLPITPQTGIQVAELIEAQANRAPAATWLGNVSHKMQDAEIWAINKLDPLKGRDVITSAPDKIFSKIAVMASAYKHAEKFGLKGGELVDRLANNQISKSDATKFWSLVDDDLTTVFNSSKPGLNKDLLASSTAGKLLFAYSAPPRRAFRYYYNLLTSGKPGDAIRAGVGMVGHAFLAGSGVVPKSFWKLAQVGGLMLGGASLVEVAREGLDELNLLKKATGMDISERMNNDFINVASPAMQRFMDMDGKFEQIAKKGSTADSAREMAYYALADLMYAVPQIGPSGTTQIEQLKKNIDYVREGSKPYYFEYNGKLEKIMINNYSFSDALRDTFVPGLPAQVSDMQQALRNKRAAKNDESKRRQNDTVNPSSTPSALPTKISEA